MKVFNLTAAYVDYRKKMLPPYGSLDYDMDFIPDRDLGLQKAGVLAFGSLPKGWAKPVPPTPALPPPPPAPKAAPPKAAQVSKPGSSSTIEFVSEKEEKKSKK